MALLTLANAKHTPVSAVRAALWIGAALVTLACWLLLHVPSLLSKPPWFGAMTSLITFSLIDQIIHLNGPNGWVAGVVWWIGMLCIYLSVGKAIVSSLKRRPREQDAVYAVLAWAALLSCLIALIFRVNIYV